MNLLEGFTSSSIHEESMRRYVVALANEKGLELSEKDIRKIVNRMLIDKYHDRMLELLFKRALD